MNDNTLIGYAIFGLALLITIWEFRSDILNIRRLNRYLYGEEKDRFVELDFVFDKVVNQPVIVNGIPTGYRTYLLTKDSNQLTPSSLLNDKDRFYKVELLDTNSTIKVKVKQSDYQKTTKKSKRFKKENSLKGLNFEIYEIKDGENNLLLFNENLTTEIFKEYRKEKRQNIFMASLKPIAVIGFYLLYRYVSHG